MTPKNLVKIHPNMLQPTIWLEVATATAKNVVADKTQETSHLAKKISCCTAIFIRTISYQNRRTVATQYVLPRNRRRSCSADNALRLGEVVHNRSIEVLVPHAIRPQNVRLVAFPSSTRQRTSRSKSSLRRQLQPSGIL